MLYAMTSTQCAGAAAWSTLGLFDCGCYHSVAAGSHAGHAMLWLAVANLPGPCALPPAAIYTRCMRALPSRCRHGVVLTGSDTAKSFNILLGQHCRGKMLGCRAASCWRLTTLPIMQQDAAFIHVICNDINTMCRRSWQPCWPCYAVAGSCQPPWPLCPSSSCDIYTLHAGTTIMMPPWRCTDRG